MAINNMEVFFLKLKSFFLNIMKCQKMIARNCYVFRKYYEFPQILMKSKRKPSDKLYTFVVG